MATRASEGASRRRGRWAVVAAITLLAVGALTQVGWAAGGKSFAAVVTPQQVAGGASTTFTLVLTNESSTQQLGSANVTPPAGFTVTAASPASVASVSANAVQLRNLGIAPGQSRSVSIQATAPCATASGSWLVRAKQANDFNGPPGNDFALDTANSQVAVSVVGSCHLEFTGQPADAVKSAAITTTPINTPAGSPVQVSVLDGTNSLVTSSTAAITVSLGAGSPNPGAGAALSGTTTKSAVGGVATFSNLSVNVHGVYVLDAVSPGVTSATSGAFGIWDTAASCLPGQTCIVSVSQPKSQSAQFFGTSSTAGALVASLGVDTISCGDTYNHAPAATTVNAFSFNASGTKTVVVRIDKVVVQQTANNGVSFYQVCYSGDAPFTDRSGNTVSLGLLPDCKTVANQPPCVASITKEKAGDVVETLTLPAGDPKFR